MNCAPAPIGRLGTATLLVLTHKNRGPAELPCDLSDIPAEGVREGPDQGVPARFSHRQIDCLSVSLTPIGERSG